MGDVRKIDEGREEDAVRLDDLAREGAWRMIAAALDEAGSSNTCRGS